MSKRFGKNDLIFLLVLLLLLGVACLFFYVMGGETGSRVKITVDGALYGVYDLESDAVISISDETDTVTNTLTISGGKAKMTKADCPDKLCMHQNAISLGGENIICLPNRVVCTVIGDADEDDFDVIVK